MNKVILNAPSVGQPKASASPLGCTLLWRRRQLIVRQLPLESAPLCSTPKDQAWLVACLQRSRVRLVKLDLACGEEILTCWVNACKQANKPLFLRLPASYNLLSKRYPRYWRLQRAVDWLGAALLLILLSPVMLLLMGLVHHLSPGPMIVREWRVGNRGRLFQMLVFRTTILSTAPGMHHLSGKHQEWEPQTQRQQVSNRSYIRFIGYWMQQSRLDQLPQLWNVLRGEMSLIGSRAYALEDALRMEPEDRYRLNALPGITGLKQRRLQTTGLKVLQRHQLEYR